MLLFDSLQGKSDLSWCICVTGGSISYLISNWSPNLFESMKPYSLGVVMLPHGGVPNCVTNCFNES